MKKDLLVIFLIFIFSIPAIKDLLIPGGYTSHDLVHHVIRQIDMSRLLSEGQFPPRWSGNLNNGFGYPLFLFNYPLPFLIGDIFHKFGLGFLDSVKAVLILSLILAPIGMYLFLKAYLGSRMAAFLGAIFYLYAPIRFLNVYVSASVGSALASSIIPFIFWSLIEMKNSKKWAYFMAPFSLSVLILAHNVTALIFAPLILAFGLFIKVKLRDFIVFLGLSLGLSAWFWMPALIEKQYIIFDSVFGRNYESQFPSIWQLLRSPWGYGLSHPQSPEPGDMSYQIGLIHILVIIIILGSLFLKKVRKEGSFWVLVFISSIFLILQNSQFLWDNLPLLPSVQFPLRFSAIAIFSASVAAALVIKYLPFKKILFISLLVLVLYANRNHLRINEKFNPGEEYFLSLKPTTASYNEHLPKWGRIMDKPNEKLEVIRGIGEIRVIRDKSAMVLAEVEATQASKLKFNQFYFPGWEIKIDGKQAQISYLEEGINMGLMLFDIDKGKHLIEAKFKNTPVRNIADGISIISVILLGFYAGYYSRFNRR